MADPNSAPATTSSDEKPWGLPVAPLPPNLLHQISSAEAKPQQSPVVESGNHAEGEADGTTNNQE